MAGKSIYQSDRVLSLLLGTTVTGSPSTYVNLFTVNPPGAGLSGTEWSMSRVQVAQTDPGTGPYWSGAPESFGNYRYISNQRTISWTTTAGYDDTQIIVGIGVWDAATGGNLLYWESFEINKTLAVDEEIALGTGALKVREK
jgi:hypothetical protein